MRRTIYFTITFIIIILISFRYYLSKSIIDWSVTYNKDKTFKILPSTGEISNNQQEFVRLEDDIKKWSNPYVYGINILLILSYIYGCYLFTQNKLYSMQTNSILLLFWILILGTLSNLLCNLLDNDAIGLSSITGAFADCLKLNHIALVVGHGAVLISLGAYDNSIDYIPMFLILAIFLMIYYFKNVKKCNAKILHKKESSKLHN